METTYQREDNHQYGVKALTRSQQDRYYEATENGASYGMLVAKTFINPSISTPHMGIGTDQFVNPIYTYLTGYVGNSTTSLPQYWVASRTIQYAGTTNTGYCWFGLRVYRQPGYGISWYSLCNSASQSTELVYQFRPVVEIPLENVTMPTAGAGTSAFPYVMF